MSLPSSQSAPAPQRSFWIAVVCGAAILTIGIGARQSFGIFQKPIAADLKVGRELWSFANALAPTNGDNAPISSTASALANDHSSRPTLRSAAIGF